MNIPLAVKIGGVVYEVILRNGTQGESTSYGSCNSGAQKIWVSEACSRNQQESTLLHEIIEAINTHYELALEHYQIACLESALYGVVVDNPELFSEKAGFGKKR